MESLLNWKVLSQMITAYIPKVIGAILVLIIGFIVANFITGIFRRSLTRTDMDKSVRGFLVSLVNVGLKVLVLFSAASMFGVETTSFIAIFSALAFAVGLALQGSLGHFASGVLILTFKPYRVGDVVKIGGEIGVVEDIQMFNTILASPDNKRVIIPNGVVTSGIITNISGQPTRRVDMSFGIGYSDDIDKARKIIQEVADSCEQVLKDKPIAILVNELADSSVNFAVRPWCNSPDYWTVYHYFMENVKKEFDRQGVSIPFPQMDVHMDKMN